MTSNPCYMLFLNDIFMKSIFVAGFLAQLCACYIHPNDRLWQELNRAENHARKQKGTFNFTFQQSIFSYSKQLSGLLFYFLFVSANNLNVFSNYSATSVLNAKLIPVFLSLMLAFRMRKKKKWTCWDVMQDGEPPECIATPFFLCLNVKKSRKSCNKSHVGHAFRCHTCRSNVLYIFWRHLWPCFGGFCPGALGTM